MKREVQSTMDAQKLGELMIGEPTLGNLMLGELTIGNLTLGEPRIDV